ncbi:MAG: hypothetical protein HQ508_05815 [Candidatus Marinimicrobia bacterium]|nr:hypothetical protein [Candidatus Neomarinimicrobiota bacterium]
MLSAARKIILIALPLSILAEGVSWNIGLISNIGRGEQVGTEYNYLENYISGSIEFGQWYLDLSVESSRPPEYGYSFQGLDRIYLSYIGDKRSIEFGNLSAVFGRGLALNLDENRAIDFDNEIIGLRFSTVFLDNHELDFVAGVNHNYRFYSPSSDLREPDGQAAYELAGVEGTFNTESGLWSLSPYLLFSQLRSDYLWRELDPSVGGVAIDTVTQTVNAIQGGWGQSVYGDTWDLYLEYNRTWKALDYPLLTQETEQSEEGVALLNHSVEYTGVGQALNLQLNWYPEWFTAMFEYKRYLNGPESASQKRDPLLLASKPLPWQMGPTGIREHDISLLGNVTHPVDYGDELGWNFELRKTLNDQWSMVLNAAQISRATEADPGFIPEQDISLNPWQEYYAEFEYSGSVFYQRVLLAYTRSVLSGQSAAEIMEHYTLVPAYFSWHPNENLVLSTVLELQASKVYGEVYGGNVLEGHEFKSGHFIASIDYAHKYSTALIWDTSNDPGLSEGSNETQNWVSAELSLKPMDGLWVRTSYGKEKGGVRCTGGVCRVLNPFEGFRLSLEWRL